MHFIISQLLNKDPTLRLGCRAQGQLDVMQSPFFKSIEWDELGAGKVSPRWAPPPSPRRDAGNFDEDYTAMDVVLTPEQPIEMDCFSDFSFVNPYFS